MRISGPGEASIASYGSNDNLTVTAAASCAEVSEGVQSMQHEVDEVERAAETESVGTAA